MRTACLALSLALILVGRAGAETAASRPQGEYIEEVVVNATRPRGVGFGVVRLQFRDHAGSVDQRVTAADVVLNDGAVRVDALVPVTRNPDLHFVVDLTTVEAQPPFSALMSLRGVAAAFPEGRARVTLIRPGRSSVVTFRISGQDAQWVGCAELLAFLDSAGHPDLGLTRVTMKAWARKHLHERLAEAAGKFPMDPDRERFLVVLSDGYDGDPLASYEPCCPPKGDPYVLHRLPARIEREARVAEALGRARAYFLFRSCSAETPYFTDLLQRYSSVWAFAPSTDRKRLSHFAGDLEGSGEWKPEADPALQVAAIVSEVRSRLDSYLLAFSTDDASTASFLKVELRPDFRARGVHAVPERIGEQLLLTNDPWLVVYSGERDSMPWSLARELRPDLAAIVEELAQRVRERFGADRSAWSTSCPFWLREYSAHDAPALRDMLAALVEPSVVDAALQSRPPAGSDVNLCALVAAAWSLDPPSR